MVLCKPQANIPFLHELPWVKKADPFLFLLTARHSKTLGLDGFVDLQGPRRAVEAHPEKSAMRNANSRANQ